MNYAEVEEVQALPFSPLDFDASNPYLHLPKPSLAGSNLEQTIKVRYYDGDQNIAHDRNIFGERKLLITKEEDEFPSSLKMSWYDRTSLFISNVKPFEKTLLMRGKFTYKINENETNFLDTYFPPESSIFPCANNWRSFWF